MPNITPPPGTTPPVKPKPTPPSNKTLPKKQSDTKGGAQTLPKKQGGAKGGAETLPYKRKTSEDNHTKPGAQNMPYNRNGERLTPGASQLPYIRPLAPQDRSGNTARIPLSGNNMPSNFEQMAKGHVPMFPNFPGAGVAAKIRQYWNPFPGLGVNKD